MIRIWNVCRAEMLDTDLKFERLLSSEHPDLYATQTEVVLSTADFEDIRELRSECQQNLFMEGQYPRTLTNIAVCTPVQEIGDRFYFTITCECML